VASTFDVEAKLTSWISRAACRQASPGLFYPAQGESPAARRYREDRAKRVCAQCPVRIDCLDHALKTGQGLGVWRGMNEPERRTFVAVFASGAERRQTP
jgi:WhiB family redox-sensing transcriptional regulator